MTDHANELRRHARKIGHPAGDVPAVMAAAADWIEHLLAKSEAAEKERDNANAAAVGIALQVGALQAECDELCTKIAAMEKQEPMELNYIELLNSAQKSVESYVYFRRFIASTPLENDIAIWMVDFVFAQLNAKGE